MCIIDLAKIDTRASGKTKKEVVYRITKEKEGEVCNLTLEDLCFLNKETENFIKEAKILAENESK